MCHIAQRSRGNLELGQVILNLDPLPDLRRVLDILVTWQCRVSSRIKVWRSCLTVNLSFLQLTDCPQTIEELRSFRVSWSDLFKFQLLLATTQPLETYVRSKFQQICCTQTAACWGRCQIRQVKWHLCLRTLTVGRGKLWLDCMRTERKAPMQRNHDLCWRCFVSGVDCSGQATPVACCWPRIVYGTSLGVWQISDCNVQFLMPEIILAHKLDIKLSMRTQAASLMYIAEDGV